MRKGKAKGRSLERRRRMTNDHCSAGAQHHVARAARLHNGSGLVAPSFVLAEQHPCSTGPPRFCRPSGFESQYQVRKVVRQNGPISSGGIIGIPGQWIKAGWRGYLAAQVLAWQCVASLMAGIHSTGQTGSSSYGRPADIQAGSRRRRAKRSKRQFNQRLLTKIPVLAKHFAINELPPGWLDYRVKKAMVVLVANHPKAFQRRLA